MKKLISDYEDEKVDALIRKAVKEEAENINAPDRIKEEIDEKIGRPGYFFGAFIPFLIFHKTGRINLTSTQCNVLRKRIGIAIGIHRKRIV